MSPYVEDPFCAHSVISVDASARKTCCSVLEGSRPKGLGSTGLKHNYRGTDLKDPLGNDHVLASQVRGHGTISS